MAEVRYDLRIIDASVFLSTFSFGMIAALNLACSFLPVFLVRNVGAYLMSAPVRQFFGLINPIEQK